uniref:Uncharacterized protein n=1 Tax=Tetraselmis sp. GSL018 TaxID=582737 RepID=A0A061SDD7_9CHLO
MTFSLHRGRSRNLPLCLAMKLKMDALQQLVCLRVIAATSKRQNVAIQQQRTKHEIDKPSQSSENLNESRP